MFRIESLLSARLFMSPQRVGEYLYFVSNMSGQVSLYRIKTGGSIPEPLLLPHIALQNPILLNGTRLYYVFEELGKILVMMDTDGDESYQPHFIPMEGGVPEKLFPEKEKHRFYLAQCYPKVAYLGGDVLGEPHIYSYRLDLDPVKLTILAQSEHQIFATGFSSDHKQKILIEGYTYQDDALYLLDEDQNKTLLFGTPFDQREAGQAIPLNGFGTAHFLEDNAILIETIYFEDTGGLGLIQLDKPQDMQQVTITGIQHSGRGEMTSFEHLEGDRFKLGYNIDGASWYYEGSFDRANLTMNLDTVLVGQGDLSDGVVEWLEHDDAGYAFSFSSATSPVQLYTRDGDTLTQHTNERILGIPHEYLSSGEDASYDSHDGLRISARLYLPSEALGHQAPYPLAYYVHGGPQSQEKPDFTWFSMPLIQYLTLNGLAVFVPNARGSTGYGTAYTKHVDRDWGGQDRLDHVHAMTTILADDTRVDTTRAGVVGRSYGGFMTLTLAGRHPELWKAAVDMFGPYDLFTFMERVPETWKAYLYMAVGHPEKDKDLLTDRSPKTHLHQLACPLMVVQGRNDPRVVEKESSDLVEGLRQQGKDITYMLFEDEGHDVLKFQNRVRCYNGITDFFKQHLTDN